MTGCRCDQAALPPALRGYSGVTPGLVWEERLCSDEINGCFYINYCVDEPESPTQSGGETPSESVAETEPETPSESVKETKSETGPETPSESVTETEPGTPGESGTETKLETPSESAKETPGESPEATPTATCFLIEDIFTAAHFLDRPLANDVRCYLIRASVFDGISATAIALHTSFNVPVVIEDSVLINCAAGQRGGAIYVDSTSNLALDRTCFYNNTALEGGGVFIERINLIYVTTCSWKECTSKQDGGAIFMVRNALTGLKFNNFSSCASALLENFLDRGGAVAFFAVGQGHEGIAYDLIDKCENRGKLDDSKGAIRQFWTGPEGGDTTMSSCVFLDFTDDCVLRLQKGTMALTGCYFIRCTEFFEGNRPTLTGCRCNQDTLPTGLNDYSGVTPGLNWTERVCSEELSGCFYINYCSGPPESPWPERTEGETPTESVTETEPETPDESVTETGPETPGESPEPATPDESPGESPEPATPGESPGESPEPATPGESPEESPKPATPGETAVPPPPAATEAPTTDGGSPSGSSLVPVIAGVVGGIVGLALIGIIIFCILKRRKNSSDRVQNEDDETNEGQATTEMDGTTRPSPADAVLLPESDPSDAAVRMPADSEVVPDEPFHPPSDHPSADAFRAPSGPNDPFPALSGPSDPFQAQSGASDAFIAVSDPGTPLQPPAVAAPPPPAEEPEATSPRKKKRRTHRDLLTITVAPGHGSPVPMNETLWAPRAYTAHFEPRINSPFMTSSDKGTVEAGAKEMPFKVFFSPVLGKINEAVLVVDLGDGMVQHFKIVGVEPEAPTAPAAEETPVKRRRRKGASAIGLLDDE